MKSIVTLPLPDGAKLEIVHLEYQEQRVLTTRQIAEVYGCSYQLVGDAFKRNIDNFASNVDYFKLSGGALRDFKEILAKKLACLPTKKLACLPLSPYTSHILLFTKSGALKLSKNIGTEKAKIIYAGLALGYFSINQEKTTDVPKGQTTLFKLEEESTTDNETNNVEDSGNFTNREKYAILKELIDKCTDEDLKNELIREAAKLILGKDF